MLDELHTHWHYFHNFFLLREIGDRIKTSICSNYVIIVISIALILRGHPYRLFVANHQDNFLQFFSREISLSMILLTLFLRVKHAYEVFLLAYEDLLWDAVAWNFKHDLPNSVSDILICSRVSTFERDLSKEDIH